MKAFLLALAALGFAAVAVADDSQSLPVSKGKGYSFTMRYEMVPDGEYQLPGIRKFYLQRSADTQPLFIFASPRHCDFSLSPAGQKVLVREYMSPSAFRLLVVDVPGSQQLSDDVKLSMLKQSNIVGSMDLGWVTDPAAAAAIRMVDTKVAPQVVLQPHLLAFAPDEKHFLLTFDEGPVLASGSEQTYYAKTFRRRYFVVDHHGVILFEGKAQPQGSWWRLKAKGAGH
jgi:hypothetical protein